MANHVNFAIFMKIAAYVKLTYKTSHNLKTLGNIPQLYNEFAQAVIE